MYAEEARKEAVERVKANPGDPWLHCELGWTLALLGRRAEAAQETKRTLELLPAEKEQDSRALYLEYVVWIHALLGEQQEAIDIVEQLLKGPYGVTAGTLRVVPWFAPLRGNPRFEKLARGAS